MLSKMCLCHIYLYIVRESFDFLNPVFSYIQYSYKGRTTLLWHFKKVILQVNEK